VQRGQFIDVEGKERRDKSKLVQHASMRFQWRQSGDDKSCECVCGVNMSVKDYLLDELAHQYVVLYPTGHAGIEYRCIASLCG
jgi:hypothetical protein